ncbi:MAG: hypothetical protein REH83_00570 [Rickettsiella sp.]|nr:hypothetical protein [Rickettsiella sp.]
MNKNYIKIDKIHEEDINKKNKHGNNVYELVFSIDLRDIELFKKFIDENRGMLDRANLVDPNHLEKLFEEMATHGYTVNELKPVSTIYPDLQNELPQLKGNALDLIQLNEGDIGKAVIALDYIHEEGKNDYTESKNNKRKVVYIQEDPKLGLIVDHCNNDDFKKEGNILVAFYVQHESLDVVLSCVKDALNNSLEGSVLTDTDNTSLIILANNIIAHLKKSNHFSKIEKHEDFLTAKKTYDKNTGERNPALSKSVPTTPVFRRKVHFEEIKDETTNLKKSHSEGSLNHLEDLSDTENSILSQKDVFQSPAVLDHSIQTFKELNDKKIEPLKILNKEILQEKNIIPDKKNQEPEIYSVLKKLDDKSKKLFKEGNKTAKHKAELLSEVASKVSLIQEKITSSADKNEVEASIQKTRNFIADNSQEISKYRSKLGSSFFFGVILRQDLQSRVESVRLMDELANKLNQIEANIAGLSI